MLKPPVYCSVLIKRICDTFETQVNKDLRENEITLSQMKMLIHLDLEESNSATMKKLEKDLGASQATIAGIAARLEKKGLIEGYIDAEDHRIKHVRLSQAGQELCSHNRFAVEEGEKRLLEALKPEERPEFQRLLQKVYIHLNT